MERLCECPLCGKTRCVKQGERRGYCFREGKTWFLDDNGRVLPGRGVASTEADPGFLLPVGVPYPKRPDDPHRPVELSSGDFYPD